MWAMAANWILVPMEDKHLEAALKYGRLMREGNVGLPNVKYQDIDNVENYADGKLGELAFYLWLKERGIKVLHHPFRRDYRTLNPDDDSVIRIAERDLQVEVRHKT
jgi:hypothetical protein